MNSLPYDTKSKGYLLAYNLLTNWIDTAAQLLTDEEYTNLIKVRTELGKKTVTND